MKNYRVVSKNYKKWIFKKKQMKYFLKIVKVVQKNFVFKKTGKNWQKSVKVQKIYLNEKNIINGKNCEKLLKNEQKKW